MFNFFKQSLFLLSVTSKKIIIIIQTTTVLAVAMNPHLSQLPLVSCPSESEFFLRLTFIGVILIVFFSSCSQESDVSLLPRITPSVTAPKAPAPQTRLAVFI